MINAYKPSGYLGTFVSNLPPNLTQDSSVDLYYNAYKLARYSIPIERVIGSFWKNEDAVKYYYLKTEASNRIALSMDEYERVLKAVELIRASPRVSFLFTSTETTTSYKQVPIFFRFENEDCKALLDGIHVDHIEKTIQPFDLKTTSKSVSDFRSSFISYGYYRQAAFYTEALKTWLADHPEYQEYSVLPFKFVVVEVNYDSTQLPVIYSTSELDIQVGMYGLIKPYKKYEGILDLIDAHKWHTTENLWDMSKEMYLSDCVLTLDVFN